VLRHHNANDGQQERSAKAFSPVAPSLWSNQVNTRPPGEGSPPPPTIVTSQGILRRFGARPQPCWGRTGSRCRPGPDPGVIRPDVNWVFGVRWSGPHLARALLLVRAAGARAPWLPGRGPGRGGPASPVPGALRAELGVAGRHRCRAACVARTGGACWLVQSSQHYGATVRLPAAAVVFRAG